MTTDQTTATHATQSFVVPPSIQPPAIGAPWPGQGGIYAGIIRGELRDGVRQPDRHVVAAVDPGHQFSEAQWLTEYLSVEGANSKNDGAANTAAMAGAGSELAKRIQAITVDGHSDFCLPAQRELMVCFINIPEHFKTSGWYWSSTQLSRYCAFAQDFEYGGSCDLHKGYECRAVAVRTIQLQSFTA